MRYIQLSFDAFKRHHSKFNVFIQRHGDKRITRTGIEWLNEVAESEYKQEGTYVLCALNKSQLVGLVIIVKYGLKESYIIVHSTFRNQHVAKEMLHKAMQDLGKLYGRVAMDNLPSLQMCFNSGMTAFHLTTGPTSKPTLWLGGGKWSRQDVL